MARDSHMVNRQLTGNLGSPPFISSDRFRQVIMKIERSTYANGHAFRCVVTERAAGWKVQQEREAVIVMDVVRRDWRHVECDLMLFFY